MKPTALIISKYGRRILKVINSFHGGILLKRIWGCVLLACLLTACGEEATFETVDDERVFSQQEPKQIQVVLPEEAVLPVMTTDTGELYICKEFEVSIQTLPGGDLNTTIQTLCGFGADGVELVETVSNGLTRYDFVWSSAGETGDLVGRSAVISDGVYHYCVTAMAPADRGASYREIWNGMFETITLS